MDARNRLARAAVAIGYALNALADGVVEHEHAVGTGGGFYELLCLLVVDPFDFAFVVKLLHRTVLPDQGEPFVIERNGFADRPDVMDRHAVRFWHDVRLGLAGWRLESLSSRPVGRCRQIV